MIYIALIQKRTEFGNRHWVKSTPEETKERFIERISNCYIKPYDIPYWDVEIFEANEINY